MRAHSNTHLPEGRTKAAEVVRIGLLGGFSVAVGERKVDESTWRLRKAASLIKLLALAPSHRLHRERAMDLLWPETAKKATSNNLRQTLHVARKTLHPDPQIASRLLSVSGEQLLLCPQGSLWVDVGAFEEAADTARRSKGPAAYRAAIELYSGELLPEDRYEEWAESRRQELRQRFLSLIVELAGLYEGRGAEEDLAPAVQVLQRVLTEEPTNEEAHVALMRLYALSGRSGEALRQYGRLSEALSSGLGAEPSASAHGLREEIATGRFAGDLTQAAAPPTEPAGPPSGETSGGVRTHNLPAQRTSFVGREREMLEVKRQLAMTRLLTLTGAGGSGKTRLALEVARDLVGAYPDGVWLVELAGISEEQLVPQAVAEALRVKEQPGQSLTDTLVEWLHNKSMLVMVDNCEHLIDAAARLADALLDGCPRLRVLATSREALGVAGETLWPVPTLSVPESQRMPTVAQLEGYEAVRLFVERASDRRPGFALAPANAAAVAEVCRRLEGVPLAIELAAAVARQRTLRGTLDWSHELLSSEEQTLFGRLAVFAGGWTLEAAEAVVGEDIERSNVLELLSRRVDKSMVVAEVGGDGDERYTLLEALRQYARERFEESGEAEAIRHRHAAFFLTLAEDAQTRWQSPKELAWLRRLETEHDNLRAALTWSLTNDETDMALWLSGALSRFWETRGHLSEGRGWLEAALGKDDRALPTARAGALLGLGDMLAEQSAFARAEACFEEALSLYGELGDRGHAAESLVSLGYLAMYRGNVARAAALFEESMAVAQESENRTVFPIVLSGLRWIASDAGNFERAQALWIEALEVERTLGSNMVASGILLNIEYTELILGNHEQATAHFEEGMVIGREMDDKAVVASALLGLGVGATLRSEPNEAEVLIKEGLTMHLELGNKMDIAEGLESLAGAAAALGQLLRAARLWGAAGALREEIDVQWSNAERMLHEPVLTAARSRLSEAAWEAAFAEGKTMKFEEAVEYALSEEVVPAAPERPPAGGKRKSLSLPISSAPGNAKWRLWLPRDFPTATLPKSSTSPSARSKITSPRSCASLSSPQGQRLLPGQRDKGSSPPSPTRLQIL